MKTRATTKLLSLFLCVCMLMPMLAACGGRDNTPTAPTVSWEITEDNVIPLDMTVASADSNTVLVLNHSEDLFSSISKDRIKLYTYHVSDSADAEAKPITVREESVDFTARVDNAKQISITLPKQEKTVAYLVYVHSSAVQGEKFGEAMVYDADSVEVGEAYSTVIGGEYFTGDVDPVITLNLQNAVPTSELKPEMITLSGLFGGLEITRISGGDSTIILETTGKIEYSIPLSAGITLSAEATSAGMELKASCNIVYRTSSIKQNSFALANGNLTFDVIFPQNTVALAVGDVLTSNGLTYTVTAVSEDNTTVTLSTPTAEETLDGAIAQIYGKALTIPAEKTVSNVELIVSIYSIGASLGALVDDMNPTETAGTYTAKLILFVKNGSWNGEITASDITFGGDFENVTERSVTKVENTYEVTITFVKEGLDPVKLDTSATVLLSGEKIKNAWGTAVSDISANLSYITPSDRLGYTAMLQYLAEHKETFKSIGSIALGFGQVMSIVGSTYVVLGMLGIVESAESKVDKLRDQIKDVEASIAALDKKLDKIGNMVSMNFSETMSAIQQNTYLTASGNWSDFISSYVVPLQHKLSEYRMAYNQFMINYISNAHTEKGKITVSLDKDGNVTMPHPLNEHYSVDGYPLKSLTAYRISAPLSGVQEKVLQNKGRLYEGYWEDICSSVQTIVAVNGNNATATTVETYLSAVQTAATLHALNEIGTVEFLNIYTSFCDAIAGNGTVAGLKPLDNFMVMLSMYYNFYGEARNDIETTIAWIGSLLLEASGLATMAYEFTPAAEEGIVYRSYERATDALIASVDDLPRNYCYIVSGVISASKMQTRIKSQNLNRLSAADLNLIIKRYNTLKKIGFDSSSSVREYLIANGAIDPFAGANWGLTDWSLFCTSVTPVLEMPMNNTVKAMVNYRASSTWVESGQEIMIGSNGKFTRSCFSDTILQKGDFVRLDGSIVNDLNVYVYASYFEDHWYWRTAEDWRVERDLGVWTDGYYYEFLIS